MKKILIATTALTLLAGAASADVVTSGSARMGLFYNGDDTNFTSRIRVQFTMSGETDGGLSFGASVRADQAEQANNESGGGGGFAGSVFLSGAFGTLTMGDVAGAAEAALGDLSSIGLTGINDYTDTNYITGDGEEIGVANPIILYAYSTGGLSLYLSTNDGYLGQSSVDDVNNYAVGASYAFGDYTAGIGYEVADDGSDVDSLDNTSQITVGGSAKFGAAMVKAIYGTADDAGRDFYGLSVDGTFGAATVTGFAKMIENDQTDAPDVSYIGIGASYDLGGGAAVKGGVVNVDAEGFDNETLADLGVSFSF